ncbi:hypothetical protein HK253_02995, partial [Streptococcus agalactiae]|nr:hypothetical protein [Streptococcus agalactiae]
MNLKSEQTSQKLMGAYYTPNEIVDYMLRWGIDTEMSLRILEPSAGDGQFIKGLKEVSSDSTIIAVEIDREESKKIPLTLNSNVKVYNQD